jgi:hypothetical protein
MCNLTKILILISLGTFFSPLSVQSCSCVLPTLKNQIKSANLVFVGTVNKIEPFGKRKNFKIITFDVLKIWKTPNYRTRIEIVAYDIVDACGYKFNLGESYLVFDSPENAKIEKTHPYTTIDLCTRTAPLDSSLEDVKKLGKPKITIYRKIP